jgi:hypothetical protein
MYVIICTPANGAPGYQVLGPIEDVADAIDRAKGIECDHVSTWVARVDQVLDHALFGEHPSQLQRDRRAVVDAEEAPRAPQTFHPATHLTGLEQPIPGIDTGHDGHA